MLKPAVEAAASMCREVAGTLPFQSFDRANTDSSARRRMDYAKLPVHTTSILRSKYLIESCSLPRECARVRGSTEFPQVNTQRSFCHQRTFPIPNRPS